MTSKYGGVENMDIRKHINDIKTEINSRAASDLEKRKMEAELKATMEMAQIKEVIIEKRLAFELATMENTSRPQSKSDLRDMEDSNERKSNRLTQRIEDSTAFEISNKIRTGPLPTIPSKPSKEGHQMGEYLPKMGSSTFRKFSHTTIPTAFAEMKPQPVRTPFQEPEPTPTFNDEPGSKPNKSSSTRLHQGPVLSSNSIVKPKQQSPFKLTMPTLGNKEVVGNKAKQPPLQISIPRLDSKETVVNKPKQPTMQMLYKPPTHFRSGPAKQQSPVSPPARQPVRPPVGTPPQGINNVNNIVSNPPGKLEEESSIYGDPSQENTSLEETYEELKYGRQKVKVKQQFTAFMSKFKDKLRLNKSKQ